MGRLTAGRGSERPTTTTYAPSRYRPSGGYSYGNPYEDFLDKKGFTDSYNRPPPRGQSWGGSWPNKGKSRPPGIPWKPGSSLSRFKPGPEGIAASISLVAQMFDQLDFELAWARNEAVAAGYSAGLAGDGFTQLCSTDPANFPGEQNFKIGQMPPVAGIGISSVTCAVSAGQQANGGWGDPIKQGATLAQMVQGSLPWTGPGAGSQAGRPFERWSKAAPGASRDIAMSPEIEARTLPLPTGDPAPAQEEEQVSGRAVSSRTEFNRGEQRSVNFNFNNGGGRDGIDETPYRRGPPERNVRERKWKLGKGGIAGDIFGLITEFGDALECAVEGIMGAQQTTRRYGGRPGEGRGTTSTGSRQGETRPLHPPKGIPQQAAFVAEHFDVGNPKMVAGFIKCMALANLKDLAIGKANREASKAFGEASGAPRGVSTKRGPSPF